VQGGNYSQTVVDEGQYEFLERVEKGPAVLSVSLVPRPPRAVATTGSLHPVTAGSGRSNQADFYRQSLCWWTTRSAGLLKGLEAKHWEGEHAGDVSHTRDK